MKALVYTNKQALSFRDEPDPEPLADEVVVKVEAVGICGSDMHAYNGEDERRPAPLILGHEAIGHIVGGKFAGRRVAINPLVTCGTCDYCKRGQEHICADRQIISMKPRPGAFAEFVRIPLRNTFEISSQLPVSQAVLAEPLAVSFHAVNLGLKLLNVQGSMARCVVLGGGPIGLTAAYALGFYGIANILIVENNVQRRTMIGERQKFRAVASVSSELLESRADLIIDAVGSAATRALACHLARPGSVIVHVGLLHRSDGIDVRKLTIREIHFTGSYCYTPSEFEAAVVALEQRRFENFDWTDERSLQDGPATFHDLANGRADAIKMILRP
ncbi:zinc-binding dehydrogenase [Bradyrhizobium sp. AUGA SZCCT0431]|uniref:zinc-dependent alcohol dehydrogenase n=1 Tax=Bradyrhizobium sp. AUGA SZCCT0431 TaxID=2807674 RepID=UPI001BAD9CFF|nr:alcohol dehydrogenase catalytic domain-containing protein [Bradyrhizobium sp. AUGA SZCCT0431]MBR1146155.1 alcohol dehydrogenase catalytic domain-containing protein [Bradyrhizobium sp. AUGA SZCCT0431]